MTMWDFIDKHTILSVFWGFLGVIVLVLVLMFLEGVIGNICKVISSKKDRK